MKKNKTTTKNNVTKNDFQKVANKVSIITIIGNVVLSVFKLLAGLTAHSNAMISDAVHSASDVFSTFVVIIGIKLAAKKPDKEHPYGHERMECVAAIILAVVLFITGLGIGMDAAKNILNGNESVIQVPGMLALIAAIVSIVSKEGMYWYTRYYAKKIDSSALMADAWHHRSDAFSSIGALIGIGGARLGFPIMDSIASLVIFVFIAKAAFDIFKDAMDKMVDHSCDEETEKKIYDCVMKNEDVKGIDLLRTRIFGNKIYIDVEIQVDASYTLQEAHDIAETVHDDIEKNFQKENCCCGSNEVHSSCCESHTAALETTCCVEATEGICCIKVLGAGCNSCHEQYENVQKAVANIGLSVEVEYITDMEKIMSYGVMSMPAIVINEKVVSMGKVLKATDVEKLIRSLGF